MLPPEIGNSHLLYLRAGPHRSLYVEVDAVRGAEPSALELDGLRSFFSEWCEKPDGITLVRSSVIPRSAARGRSADALAQQFMDGPVIENPRDQPAYLYVLFYDNRLNRNPEDSPRGKSVRVTRANFPPQLAKSENPHVVLFPYPAMIYVDRSWLGGLLPRKFWKRSLLHESGHVLGLVRRQSQASELHCPTDSCCMASVSENVKSDLCTWLTRGRPKPELCESCAAELRGAQASGADSSSRFIGPVLVRTTGSYQVLFLPGACGLYIVDSLDTEIPRFIAEWRKHREDTDASGRVLPWFSGKVETHEDRALQALQAAKKDPVEGVRKMAAELERNVQLELQRRAAQSTDPVQRKLPGQ